jgi:hypothetical protein
MASIWAVFGLSHGFFHHVLPVGCQFIDHPYRLRLRWGDLPAFHHEGQSFLDSEQAGHTYYTPSSGDQTQGDLGETQFYLGVIHGDAVMARQCKFKPSSQRGAVDSRHHGSP